MQRFERGFALGMLEKVECCHRQRRTNDRTNDHLFTVIHEQRVKEQTVRRKRGVFGDGGDKSQETSGMGLDGAEGEKKKSP